LHWSLPLLVLERGLEGAEFGERRVRIVGLRAAFVAVALALVRGTAIAAGTTPVLPVAASGGITIERPAFATLRRPAVTRFASVSRRTGVAVGALSRFGRAVLGRTVDGRTVGAPVGSTVAAPVVGTAVAALAGRHGRKRCSRCSGRWHHASW
jgi:hypothetical protein